MGATAIARRIHARTHFKRVGGQERSTHSALGAAAPGLQAHAAVARAGGVENDELEGGAQLHIAAPAAKESSDASKDLFRWATSEAGSGEARDFLDKLVAWTDCYGTQWWREEEGPTAGGGFTPSPELPDSLLSLLGEGEAYSAKMLFCSCGSSNVAVAAAGHLKTTGWVLLGCALCFALIFAVELRLLCDCARAARGYRMGLL